MQLGKYQLVRKLASGGMAEVFLVKAAGPRGFEKTLVLKRILPHLAEDEAFVEMFLGEAKLAAQLDHPNVVQIFDFGEADGSYFLAMEYIDGPTLRRLIKQSVAQQAPLPVAVCAKLVASAAEGLAFAHELTDPETGALLGLIHRDISPENILVSRQGAVKVVDFGIAKVAGQSHRTQTGVVKGKVAYMPPEQLQAKAMDARVDVYALGMVLYELLTGRRPFEATTDVSMMQAILFEPFVPAVERRADLPVAMQRILEKALAKDREQRYPDCRAFQSDLERFVLSLGEPVGAYQIARLVAQVAEGGAVVPTPVRVESKGREPAAPVVEEKAPSRPVEPRAVERLTTPVRGGAAARQGPEDGRSMAAPAQTASGADEVPSGMLDAATDPATPSAGSLLAEALASPRPVRKSPAPVSPAPVPVAPVQEQGRGSRRGVVVASVVALGVLASVGGWMFLGRGEQAVTPEVPSSPVVTKNTVPAKPPEPPAPEVRPASVVAVPVVAQAVDAGTRAVVVAEPGPVPAVTGAPVDAGVATVAAGPAQTKVPPRRPPVSTSRRNDLPKGKLEFRIRPYASVYLDGKSLGQTPFAAVEATEGSHQVRVVNKDLGKDVTRTFVVKAGQDNVFKLNLLTE
ncbi:serine/threonine protein kinase [Corallococcus sicarius]|uniref:Serine/threonine protein kinase n=1 Tax=Corallococcus sicarius TaxID=2316726 RepID=A0A3A8N423_9BACT|nr:serine/threonine-protein kinase [Corallococcus sicarius]RKH39157.1 serine/threonine protein kinase [Corallococcus sicarius]